MAPSKTFDGKQNLEVLRIWLAEKLGQVGEGFFCRVDGFWHCSSNMHSGAGV
jgi:hypothetical protein